MTQVKGWIESHALQGSRDRFMLQPHGMQAPSEIDKSLRAFLVGRSAAQRVAPVRHRRLVLLKLRVHIARLIPCAEPRRIGDAGRRKKLVRSLKVLRVAVVRDARNTLIEKLNSGRTITNFWLFPIYGSEKVHAKSDLYL